MDVVAAKYLITPDGLKVFVLGPNSKTRLIDAKPTPYFYVQLNDSALRILDKYRSKVVDIEHGFESIDGNKVSKVKVEIPGHVKFFADKMRSKGIPTYESDIIYVRRWMIDNNITIPELPKKLLFFDIEVDPRGMIPSDESVRAAKNRVIAIVGIGSDGKEYLISSDDEREMFAEFWSILHKYHAVVGYNSIGFDWPYLVNRGKKIGVPFGFTHYPVLDMFRVYGEYLKYNRGYGEVMDLSLDHVAEKELGERKKNIGGYSVLWNLFVNKRDELLDYCRVDAWLTMKLYEKFGMGHFWEVARFTHTFPQDVVHATTVVDSSFLSWMVHKAKRKFVLPKCGQWKYSAKVSKYDGATILEPAVGLHRNVFCFDFTSLYPTTMITFNMGPDTFTDENYDVSFTEGYGFTFSVESEFAAMLKEMLDRRLRYKRQRKNYPPDSFEYRKLDAKQNALKVIINSVYGVFNGAGFRFTNPKFAESVVNAARQSLLTVKKIFELKGFKVLYGDTDSVFVSKEGITPSWMLKNYEAILEEVNGELKDIVVSKYNVPRKRILLNLDCEAMFDRIYFVKKKMYIGDYFWKGVLKVGRMVKGLILKKYNFPDIVREVQLQLLEMKMAGKGEDDILDYLINVKEKLLSGAMDDKLVIAQRVNDPKTYKSGLNVYAKAALKMGDRFVPGSIVRLVYVTDEDVEPVIDGKIPKISFSGRIYYWTSRVRNVVEDLLGEDFIKRYNRILQFDKRTYRKISEGQSFLEEWK